MSFFSQKQDDICLLIENLPLKQRLRLYCANRQLRQLIRQQVRFSVLLISGKKFDFGQTIGFYNSQECCCDRKLKQQHTTPNLLQLSFIKVNLKSTSWHRILEIFNVLFARLRCLLIYTRKTSQSLNLELCPHLEHLSIKFQGSNGRIYADYLHKSDFIWSKMKCLQIPKFSWNFIKKHFPSLKYLIFNKFEESHAPFTFQQPSSLTHLNCLSFNSMEASNLS